MDAAKAIRRLERRLRARMGIDEHARVVTVGHGGGQQGTSTFFTIASAQDEGIVVLVNMEDAYATALATDLLKIALATEPDKQEPMIEH